MSYYRLSFNEIKYNSFLSEAFSKFIHVVDNRRLIFFFFYDLETRRNVDFSNHPCQVASARADVRGLLDSWPVKKWNTKTVVSSRNSSYRHKGWYHYFFIKILNVTDFFLCLPWKNPYNLRNDLFWGNFRFSFCSHLKPVWPPRSSM